LPPSVSSSSTSEASSSATQGLRFTLLDDGTYSVVLDGNYNDRVTHVEIPSTYQGKPVTKIGFQAFARSSITSISIPNSIVAIDNDAFDGCKSLTAITIPDSVTSLGQYVLRGCDNLKSIKLGNGIKSIKRQQFESYNVETFILGDGITEIPDSMFDNFHELKTVTLGKKIARIGKSAFYACDALQNVNFPSSLTEIGDSAFQSCERLESAILPDSLQAIPKECFYGCKGLKTLKLPRNLASIGDFAFYHTGIETLDIPASVTSITPGAFCGCPSLKRITVDQGNKKYDCRHNSIVETATNTLLVGSLSSVIPSSITVLGNYCFAESKITAITIPGSVTSIKGMAFYEANQLADIRYAGTKAQWGKATKDATSFYKVATSVVHCQDGDVSL